MSVLDSGPAEERGRLGRALLSEPRAPRLRNVVQTCLMCDHTVVPVGLPEQHSAPSRMELNMCLMENYVIETLINVSPPVHIACFHLQIST